MTRVYVGNLDPRVTERDLEDEFRIFGCVGRSEARPPGYAFIEFDDRRDAIDAIRELDGKNGWRVELSHNSKGGGGRGGRRGGGEDMKCYECGEPGHFARECRLRIGSRGLGSGRNRSPSPHRCRSPSYGYGRRSYSPRGRRSPRRRSITPRRGRSYSRSPSYRHSRRDSPYANGVEAATTCTNLIDDHLSDDYGQSSEGRKGEVSLVSLGKVKAIEVSRRGMENDYTRIMFKGKLNLFDIFKQALTIPNTNISFIIFSFLTSLPFFCFFVFFEINILQGVFLQATKFLQQPLFHPDYYYYSGRYERPNLLLGLIQLFVLYLIPYQLLEFLNIITIVPTASMIYAAEKPVSFRDMMIIRKTRLKGPFITSIYVHLLSTTMILGLAGFLINCCIMAMGFKYQSYFDVLVTMVRGVGFTALFVKFLEWSAGWNMALVISILEEKYGIEALKFSAYINRNCSQRGLILMLVFFVWGLIIRLSCIFYGYNGELASVLFTFLICLGNLMKWVICVVYYFDCKKGILENNVDDEEVGRDVVNVLSPYCNL
ncbi:hypothetical protein PTKIN_Ptkin02bG0087900 [Pterospermum kingtungense]